MAYVRFQSAEPNAEGRHPGFFGLINALSKAGRLTPEQEEFRRSNHAWYESHYTNPATVDPTVYDHSVNPGATAWFKESAEALVARADGYLKILDAHGVRCDKLVSHKPPGKIIYEDGEQIVSFRSVLDDDRLEQLGSVPVSGELAQLVGYLLAPPFDRVEVSEGRCTTRCSGSTTRWSSTPTCTNSRSTVGMKNRLDLDQGGSLSGGQGRSNRRPSAFQISAGPFSRVLRRLTPWSER